MGLFNDFLNSGHIFRDKEYEVKSKFRLINAVIFITLIIVGLLTIFLFIDHKIYFAIANCIYISLGIVAVLFLRKSKNNYKKIVPFIPSISVILVMVAMSTYPTEQVRLSWFFVVIISAYFLGGRRLGYIATLLSIFSVLFVDYFFHTSLTSYTLTLAIVIMLLASMIVNFYENREVTTKKRLHDMNVDLELRVKEEMQKRIIIYEKSNNELKKSAEELEEQKNAYKELAFYDTLTKLPNRVLFYDRLKHSIDKSKRNKNKLAVLFLDLDNFKEINDSLGHHIGDLILQIVAKRLEKKIRKSDTLARLGGDEFTLILEDLYSLSKIGEIAYGLIQVVSEPIKIKEHELYVTVSIGISIYPDDAEDIDSILKCADAAMYSAKKEGCNLTHFYKKEMTDESLERLKLESSIRYALKNDEFIIYYQPIVDSTQNRLIGLEALVRWQHPEKGLLTPQSFIDVAESSSLIIQLGEVVLQKVTEQVEVWHKKGFDPEFISVNLSVKQLRHQGLLPTISNILEKINFRTDWLELEITESYTMQNPTDAIGLLNKIRELGIKFSIDDFGTGYSSLAYLKKLPVDKLKIDRSFVNDITYNEDDSVLVSTIVSMARSMSLDVVAEGVETAEQRKSLQSLGCNKMQGYFFDRPMSSMEIEKKYIK